MNTPEQDIKLITDHVNALGEHFDTVQIFCTRHEPTEADGTIAIQKGVGNWFARYGHIRTWIAKQDESSRIEERKDSQSDNPN